MAMKHATSTSSAATIYIDRRSAPHHQCAITRGVGHETPSDDEEMAEQAKPDIRISSNSIDLKHKPTSCTKSRTPPRLSHLVHPRSESMLNWLATHVLASSSLHLLLRGHSEGLT